VIKLAQKIAVTREARSRCARPSATPSLACGRCPRPRRTGPRSTRRRGVRSCLAYMSWPMAPVIRWASPFRPGIAAATVSARERPGAPSWALATHDLISSPAAQRPIYSAKTARRRVCVRGARPRDSPR